jgi:hypothetical protein
VEKSYHKLEMIPDSVCIAIDKNNILCSGGKTDPVTVVADVKLLNYRLQKWKDVAPMARPRVYHSVVYTDGNVYALGGFHLGPMNMCE